jgi:hypothetical protein
VKIHLGERLSVQSLQKGDVLQRPRLVKVEGKKAPTPTFNFIKMGEMLILLTQNPYSKDLRFRAAMRLKGRTDEVETSIVPVQSEIVGIELWQDPIEELVLFDSKLSNEQ